MWLDGGDMKDLTEIDRVVNRHIARLMTELEEANCPAIFRDAVKGRLSWLRKDLNELNGNDRHERNHNA